MAVVDMLVGVDETRPHGDGRAHPQVFGHRDAPALGGHLEGCALSVRRDVLRRGPAGTHGGEVHKRPRGIGAHDEAARLIAQVEVALGGKTAEVRGKGARRHGLAERGVAVDDDVPVREDPGALLVSEPRQPYTEGLRLKGAHILKGVDEAGSVIRPRRPTSL